MSEELAGQCHCGALRVDISLSKPANQTELRACQCSFCVRHGSLTFTDPQGSFHLYYECGQLNRYRMGFGLTDFLICARCGTYVAALMETDKGTFATVNALGLGLSAFESHSVERVEYAKESAEERRARRFANWTPAIITQTDASGQTLNDCA